MRCPRITLLIMLAVISVVLCVFPAVARFESSATDGWIDILSQAPDYYGVLHVASEGDHTARLAANVPSGLNMQGQFSDAGYANGYASDIPFPVSGMDIMVRGTSGSLDYTFSGQNDSTGFFFNTGYQAGATGTGYEIDVHVENRGYASETVLQGTGDGQMTGEYEGDCAELNGLLGAGADGSGQFGALQASPYLIFDAGISLDSLYAETSLDGYDAYLMWSGSFDTYLDTGTGITVVERYLID